MCEQTEVNYLDGDVVWVKLGPCWWPGEVHDVSKLPPEIVKDFKKQPIAVVKFFQEDQYEYVKNINHIYKYNCRKKNEFIKKGLDMHRAKNTFMDKFPADVCYAESITGGDPDIITSDEFAPEQKTNYSQIFGSPTPKRSSSGKGRPSLGTPKSSHSSVSPQRRITHPRFLGQSDHKTRVLEQSTPTPSSSHYKCHICGFESTRLNVIVLHNRSHSNGTYVSPKSPKSKKSNYPKKTKRPKSFATTNSIDEDLELIRAGAIITTELLSSDTESIKEHHPKLKSSSGGGKRKGTKTTNSGASKKAKVSNICNNLLADWGDSDSNEEEVETTAAAEKSTKPSTSENKDKTDEEGTKNKNIQNELLEDWDDKNSSDKEVERIFESKTETEKKTEAKASEKSSCFDFEDEEEHAVLEKSPGRKIPRVIPAKRISKDIDDSDKIVENEEPTKTEESNKEDPAAKNNELDLTAFKNILDETEVPDFSILPEIDISKKLTDKKIDESIDKTNGVLKKESPTKAAASSEAKETESEIKFSDAPKKRIVRNFEEFESLLNEQKQPDEETVKDKSTLEVSKLKSQLMSKLNDTSSPKKESHAGRKGTSRRRRKDSEIFEPPEPEKTDSSHKTDEVNEENLQEPEQLSTDTDMEEKIVESEELYKRSEEVTEITKDTDIKDTEKFDELEEKAPEEIIKSPIPEAPSEFPDEMEIEFTTTKTEENNFTKKNELVANEPITEVSKDIIENEDIEKSEEETAGTETNEDVINETEDENKKDDIESPAFEPVEINRENIPEQEVITQETAEIVPPVEADTEVQVTPVETATEEESTESAKPQKMLVDISDICIDNADNLSGLSTLAAVSELTGNLYEKTETTTTEIPIAETQEESEQVTNPSLPADDVESRDLTPVQDEISQEPIEHKRIQTLANFSMDFSDSNSESTIIKSVGKDDNMLIENTENVETEIAVVKPEEGEIKLEEEIKSEEEIKLEDKIPSESKDTDNVPAPDASTEFESIENEIEKITAMETSLDKLNSFPENISQVSQDDSINIESSEITYSEFSLSESSPTITTAESEFNRKMSDSVVAGMETTLESEIAKLTDTHPDAETVVQEQQQNTTSSKLLEILTDSKNLSSTAKSQQLQSESPPSSVTRTVISSSGTSQRVQMVITSDSKSLTKKFDPKTSKLVIKSAISKSQLAGKSSKPIILSEKIIKPVTEIENVSVKKITSKRTHQDAEDIDAFIIQKSNKKQNSNDNDQQDIILTPKSEGLKIKGGARGARGKPKIIEQTIIKAADVVQQSPVALATSESQPLLDDSMFDINSMPIVLSDQILTPESIENMPVVMTDLLPSSSVASAGVTTVQTTIAEKPQQTIAVKRGGAIQQVKLLNKGKVSASQSESSPKVINQNVVVKNIIPRGLGKNQKLYQTGSKLLKNNPAVITQPGKPGKFIILPSTTSTTTSGSKYTVGKRLTTVKNMSPIASPTTSKLKSVQNVSGEPTGNKIMIVTNQQGVQSRVLLTPAQQKLISKMPTTKISKSPQAKGGGGIMQKSILTSKGTIINSPSIKSTLASQAIVTSKGQLLTAGQTLVTSEGQVLTPITQQQLKSLKPDQHKLGKKIQMQSSRVLLPDSKGETSQKMNIVGQKTKTILIKGSQGQTLKKIQTPVNESKNMLLSPGGQKSQLMSLSGQHIQGGLSGKQVMVTSKGQIIKSDVKVSSPESVKLMQRLKSPKTSLGTPTRIISKSNRTTQMLLSPVSSSSVNKPQQLSTVGIPPLAPLDSGKKDTLTQMKQHNEQKLAAASLIENKEKVVESTVEPDTKAAGEQKQPNQLIIQDTLGNQTTVTEGQILALPSGETVEGQPQSYVLVTVDEAGNLIPISNDTLMSLDPNLALGGDMNNIVLQIDQQAQDSSQTQEVKPAESSLPAAAAAAAAPEVSLEEQGLTTQTTSEMTEQQQQQLVTMDNQQLLPEQNLLTTTASEQQLFVSEQSQQEVFADKPQENFTAPTDETQQVITTTPDGSLLPETQQTAVTYNINSGDNSQQLIITGDPESTQKFLASLSEGNTDLSSLLSGTDGNIIINTDGQQILLNTDSDNQILLSVNSDNLGLIQPGTEDETAPNSMYVAQQTIKNQDILAAALADTDVFQQESAADKHNSSQVLTKVSSSSQAQLSPNSSLYPMNVGNVLETSLTLGSPIMTPLEVPSVNNKKVINSDVESTLMTQVPSSLELPITITDPSISQTVSQQVMLGNDLQANLELPISISEAAITSIRSSEMNSPSFVYSLPSLDENSVLDQKRAFTESSTVITTENIYNTALTGSMSMPLLTEEPEIPPVVEQEQISTTSNEEIPVTSAVEVMSPAEITVSESNQSTTNFDVITTESLPEKTTSELQIGSVEEEFGLNTSGICSSLSEPPPGIFDKSSFSLNRNYLSNKEDESNIPLPSESSTTTTTEPTTSTESSVLNEPITSMPALLEQETTENTSTSDMLAASEKNTNGSSLDMEYGVPETTESTNSISEPVLSEDVQRSSLTETPNSDLNSPRLDIDENSGEIPIQPPIITNLSETFEDNNTSEEFANTSADDDCKKRVNEEEGEDEIEAKKTKFSCD